MDVSACLIRIENNQKHEVAYQIKFLIHIGTWIGTCTTIFKDILGYHSMQCYQADHNRNFW